MYELGDMCFDGNGAVQDYDEALRWFQLAAAQGDPDAFCKLGVCHQYGCGVRRCKAAAISWFKRAIAAQGWGERSRCRYDAQSLLSSLLLSNKYLKPAHA